MSATITCVPSDPEGVVTACRIEVSGADTNDASTSNPDGYPISDAFVYFLRARKSGVDDLKSNLFSVSADGDWVWNNVIFPEAGSWTVTLRDNSDDSQVATASVTVS